MDEIPYLFQTSTASPLKFGNGEIISSHILYWCSYLSMLGLKLIHDSTRIPWSQTSIVKACQCRNEKQTHRNTIRFMCNVKDWSITDKHKRASEIRCPSKDSIVPSIIIIWCNAGCLFYFIKCATSFVNELFLYHNVLNGLSIFIFLGIISWCLISSTEK